MDSALVRFVLRRLVEAEEPIIGIWELRDYPEAAVSSLIRAGILRETEAATEVPRSDSMLPGPPLLVRVTAQGLFGVADEDDYHDPVPLEPDAIRQFTVDIPSLIARIREDNGMNAGLQISKDDPYWIGELTRPGPAGTIVRLSLRAPDENALLDTVRRVMERDDHTVILLVPLPVPVKPETQQLIRSWGVVVVPLSEHVGLASWELPWEELLPPPETDETQLAPPGSYCRLVSHDSNCYITKSEYDKITHRSSDYDLFIDGTTFEAHRREGRKGVARARLTPAELDLLVQYMSASTSIRLSATRVGIEFGFDTANKAFESARRKVDKRIARYKWQAFKMIRSISRTEKAHHFDPPETMTFCLLISLGTSRQS